MSKKEVEIDEVVIKGVTYVPKDQVKEKAESFDGMDFVLVRTYSAGVHCGYLKERDGMEVTLLEAIRIWSWKGAAACSQIAMEGISSGKLEMASSKLIVTAIEIHDVTQIAKDSIKSIVSWKV
jgi:hypothetical protein